MKRPKLSRYWLEGRMLGESIRRIQTNWKVSANMGRKFRRGGGTMINFNCTLCKMLLNAVSHAAVAAVLIRVASAYRYVQVFV
jgi:hypothetical protein